MHMYILERSVLFSNNIEKRSPLYPLLLSFRNTALPIPLKPVCLSFHSPPFF